MIKSFKNKGTEDVFNGKNTKEARKLCPRSLWKIASRKLDQVDSAIRVDDLRIPPGNMLEALKGNRKEEHSIRINEQYRICFKWSETGPSHIEIIDYH
jgi:proteic killer suppression protein